ncbi:MAG: hypothetical protein ACXU7D_03915, partial [Burkholderiaceae bacterium]
AGLGAATRHSGGYDKELQQRHAAHTAGSLRVHVKACAGGVAWLAQGPPCASPRALPPHALT